MYIAIEGNIGAGKTTLAKALAKKLNAYFLAEKFEENTLLPLFYENKRKLALLTEFSFLIERQNQLFTYFKKINKNKITVSDFDFDKCLCFAKANLNAENFKLYKKNHSIIKSTIPTPDLIVYLDVELDLLLKNIKKRKRTIEKNIAESYLNKVNNVLIKHYATKNENITNVLVIPLNKNNIEVCCDIIIKVLSLKR